MIDTPFQLISGFFHVNKVLSVAQGCVGGGATGLLNKGGGEQQASWFSKQQAVEFPQVQTSLHNNVFAHGTVTNDDHVSQSKGWAKLTPIQSLLTLSDTYRGTC